MQHLCTLQQWSACLLNVPNLVLALMA